MHRETDSLENKPIQTIRKYWPVVIFIFALGGLYVNLTEADLQNKNKINELSKTQIEFNVKLNTVDISQNTIMVQLSQIQTDIEWIKKNINK